MAVRLLKAMLVRALARKLSVGVEDVLPNLHHELSGQKKEREDCPFVQKSIGSHRSRLQACRWQADGSHKRSLQRKHGPQTNWVPGTGAKHTAMSTYTHTHMSVRHTRLRTLPPVPTHRTYSHRPFAISGDSYSSHTIAHQARRRPQPWVLAEKILHPCGFRSPSVGSPLRAHTRAQAQARAS